MRPLKPLQNRRKAKRIQLLVAQSGKRKKNKIGIAAALGCVVVTASLVLH